MSPKQQQFVEEYLIDLNATQAAIRAGYSARTAQEQASRLLSNVMVQTAIQAAMLARSERVKLNADDVLQELAILGRSDLWNYEVDDRGKIRLAEGVPRTAIRAVASIKHKVRHLGEGQIEYETEIKLWDKNSALEKAGKHLGLFKDDVNLHLKGPPFKVYANFDPREVVCPPPNSSLPPTTNGNAQSNGHSRPLGPPAS